VWLLPPTSWPLRIVAGLGVVGLINAFNMLDNMDGLSGGVAFIAAGYLAVLGALLGGEWLSFVVLMGAVAGFLLWNRPPAKIFLGDAGSTFLGFLIALGTARLALRPGGPAGAWAMPLCVAAVPCYDLLSVVTLRLSQGRSPFHADKQHLSHRLVARGLAPPAAVGVIHLMAVVCGLNAVILCFVTTATAAGLVVGQLAGWWVALACIEFLPKKP
jgi:UDP-GlcNAc:undecaprenyl-phosphate GlcNAc-1-phosphate transferase